MSNSLNTLQAQINRLANAQPDLAANPEWRDSLQTINTLLEQVATLCSANAHLSSHFDLDLLLSEVAEFSVNLLGADAVVIKMLDRHEEHLVIKAMRNAPKNLALNQTEPVDQSFSADVIATQEPVLANDWSRHTPDTPIQAMVSVPIIIQKKLFGAIEVYSYTNSQAFGDNDLYILSLLSAQTAAAIENTDLFNQAETNYRFLETIIDHIPDPLVIKNRDYTWIAVNQASAEAMGRSKNELINKTDHHHFATDLADEFYRRDAQIFAANKIVDYEDKITWGDGQEHVVYTRLIPIANQAGEPEYVLGISHDITQRKAHEAERERYSAEMAALYKGSQAMTNALSERQIFETLFEQIQLEDPALLSAFGFETVQAELIWAELKTSWQKPDKPAVSPGTKLYLPDAPHARLLKTDTPIFIDDAANSNNLTATEREALAPDWVKSLAILPLISNEQKIGAVIVYFSQTYHFSELIQRFWMSMADQAAVALRNHRLIEEAAYRAIQMETAAEIAQAASSILDLNTLLNTAVDLIRDRFELYYVGAFLVDETQEWAVLRAGTGEAGDIQLKKQHRLKIGGESMIGWSIANQEPRIALDVGQDAVHFQNPDLPDTRSEMALPLIYHGRAIGALTVQSTAQAAFSREDIVFLQTMANQLANAIENARLFEQMQTALYEREEAEIKVRQFLAEAQYRSELLQAAAKVSSAASSIIDIHELINTSVNLIRDHFDFYYVGLFLVDEAKQWAVLRAGTGDAGRLQIENNHRLQVGSESMIGWSIANRQARIALDVGEEAVRFQNPYLPDTHSEMALPLISRAEALGALTVQSVKRNAFSKEDITLLQTMADQLANALSNARLFEESETRLRETQALQQLSQKLARTLEVSEILQIFFQACTQEIGFEYVQLDLVDKTQHIVKAIDGIGVPKSQFERAIKSLDSQDIMADIIRTGQTEVITGWDNRFDKEIFETEGHSNWMRIFTPVTLRHENIGLVEAGFKDKRATIDETQIRLLNAFINQMALALDNAQRYDASQKRAQREALIKEITTKVRASTDLDTILQTTVKEVGKAVNGHRTYIQLLPAKESNGNQSDALTDPRH